MKKYLILFLFSFCLFTIRAQTPVELVELSLIAYNEQNIDDFMSYFSDDISLYDFNSGDLRAEGKEQIREIFEPFFKESPDLHSRIVNRIAFDNKVIDHESITGARGNKEAFEVTMIYEIKGDQIVKMTSIRPVKKD